MEHSGTPVNIVDICSNVQTVPSSKDNDIITIFCPKLVSLCMYACLQPPNPLYENLSLYQYIISCVHVLHYTYHCILITCYWLLSKINSGLKKKWSLISRQLITLLTVQECSIQTIRIKIVYFGYMLIMQYNINK